MNQIVSSVENLVQPVLAEESIELVDLAYQNASGRKVLCFYLDKPGGITLDDCEKWGRRIGELLEHADIIDGAYSLEVSSPGMYRVLKKESDFNRFIGERIAIKLFAPVDGQKNFHGICKGAKDKIVRIEMDGSRLLEFNTTAIAKANLDPEIQI